MKQLLTGRNLSQHQTKGLLLPLSIHSIYIRTVSSQQLLSALLNWFKLVYGPFGQSNMQPTLDFCPDKARQITEDIEQLRSFCPNIVYCAYIQHSCNTSNFSRNKLQTKIQNKVAMKKPQLFRNDFLFMIYVSFLPLFWLIKNIYYYLSCTPQ